MNLEWSVLRLGFWVLHLDMFEDDKVFLFFYNAWVVAIDKDDGLLFILSMISGFERRTKGLDWALKDTKILARVFARSRSKYLGTLYHR